MKHTPGPWSACHNGECQCKTVMGNDYPVATITSGNWGDDYPSIRLVGDSSLELKAEAYMEQITYGKVSEETAVANARLIAASPELLEACKQIDSIASRIQKWQRQNLEAMWYEDFQEIVTNVRAAIAKAEGE
jgi:hypothetical protein